MSATEVPERDERPDDETAEVVELLNELRVVLPGVQVLFAFLLTVPFTQRFEQLTDSDRAIYFAALLAVTGASAMLIAPSVHARLVRKRKKDWLMRASTVLVIAGTAFLTIAIGCSVYLVADFIYDSSVAALATTVVVVTILSTWYGLPMFDRLVHDKNR